MKLKDAIEQIDRLKPNKFTDEEKTKWLYELDGKIFREIVETHVRPAYLASIRYLRPYVAGQDDELVLLAPEPHDVVYRWWLECQIDIGNNEISRYNNSRTMFNQAYEELQGWWNRMYMPVGPVDAIGFTLGRRPGPHPHGMPPDAHGPHEHHHILAKDVVNALGYRPEVEGKAAELDEKVMQLLEAEEHTRSLGDDNTLIAAKAYADSRIEYASADISMDVDEKLGKLYEDVTGNMVAMRVLIDTAVGSAEGAQRAAENVLDASRNVVSDARQSIALANAATAEAREAYRAAMALEDGARVAEQLKGDAEFMESVTGKDGKDGVDGRDGRDGVDGVDGKDAEITPEAVMDAIGYKPVPGYELIEEFSYDGSTNVVYRNQTPDGRAYAFSDFILLFDGNGSNVVHSAVIQANGSKLWGSDRVLIGNTYSEARQRAIIYYSCDTGAFVSASASGVFYSNAAPTFSLVKVPIVRALEINTNGVTAVAGAKLTIYARWAV